MRLQNWAGNLQYGAVAFHEPATTEAVQEIVARAAKIRPLGTRHSFNRIADTNHELISLRHLERSIQIDRDAAKVRIDGGITYAELCPLLDEAGFALPNLASLPHISVAGSVATGTHGSGVRNGNLATSVSEIEFVRADGGVVALGRDDADFAGAVVAIGALGPVIALTLDLVPRFEVRQFVFEDLPAQSLRENFAELMAATYSVSLFTNWRSGGADLVWCKSVGDWPAPAELFGANRAAAKLHPLKDHDPVNVTDQLGVSGPWFDRLPHFRAAFTPSSGEELQSEYFVDRIHAVDAIAEIQALSDEIYPHLFVTEIRTIAADEMWLSPNFRRDSLAVHFTWRPHFDAVMSLLPKIEARLAPFSPRAHWGKLFTRRKFDYPKMPDFVAMASKYDPAGKFRNELLDELFAGSEADS